MATSTGKGGETRSEARSGLLLVSPTLIYAVLLLAAPLAAADDCASLL